MTNDSSIATIRSINGHLRIGVAAAALLVIGVGGVAATTQLSGAVLAQGTVVVDGNVKVVQHPVGGVVEEINIRNGAVVKVGQVLIRLDDDIARADLATVDNALDALFVRRARLEAERDGTTSFSTPPELTERLRESSVERLLRSESRYLQSRTEAREGLKAQLAERIVQLENQIEGLAVQITAQQDAIALVQEELSGLDELYTSGLVTKTRVMALRREEAIARGTHGQLVSEIASQKGRVSETRLQIIQIDQDMTSEVNGELREIEEKVGELTQRRIAALDQLKRIDIRAPHDGVVHELGVHTIGAVVEAGKTLMLIVPEEEELSIEVKVAAQDRDQLHIGQNTLLRMSSFNQRTTPELEGTVNVIGADLVEDPRTGFQYYPVRIRLNEGQEERLGASQLAPGMPVESFVQTGYRTVFSYLTKPLVDYFALAFRAD